NGIAIGWELLERPGGRILDFAPTRIDDAGALAQAAAQIVFPLALDACLTHAVAGAVAEIGRPLEHGSADVAHVPGDESGHCTFGVETARALADLHPRVQHVQASLDPGIFFPVEVAARRLTIPSARFIGTQRIDEI